MIKAVNGLLLSTLGDAPDVPRVLVGSMKDLASQRQVNQAVSQDVMAVLQRCFIVSYQIAMHSHNQATPIYDLQDAQQLAESWGVPYVECSSKSGESVAEVFHTLMKEIEKDDGLLAETNEGPGCMLQ
jgi:Ras family protein